MPDISVEEYRAILRAYLSFYEAAEDLRKSYQLVPALSFATDIGCLKKDLTGKICSPPAVIPVKSMLQAIGLLYVLHGSRFGAMTIYQNLRRVMPGENHVFFGRRPSKETWHLLLSRIEEQAGRSSAISEVSIGAETTFDAFDSWLRCQVP